MELPYVQRALVAARLLAGLNANFAHWDALPDFDLDATFRAYLSEAFAAGDRLAFDLATLRFVALFRNGHTAFDDAWLWSTHGAPPGVDVQRFAAGWFVTASALAKVPCGAEVLAVDGNAIEAFCATQRFHIAACSERAAERRLFSRPDLFPAAFRLTLDGGRDVRIRRGQASLRRAAEPKSRWLVPDRIALLRIPSFERPEYEVRAVAAVRRLESHVSRVIDLRGNGGGGTPAMLIEALMTRPYRDWRATTPMHVALSWAQGGPRETRELPASWHDPSPDAFSGPLAFLIDGARSRQPKISSNHSRTTAGRCWSARPPAAAAASPMSRNWATGCAAGSA